MTQQDSLFQFSLVIPVYNSADILPILYERVDQAFRAWGYTYEIVFVNDNSRDQSWKVLKAIRKDHPDNVQIYNLSRNYGQHNALMCGFRAVRGLYIVTIDDDLQNPPEEINRMYQHLLSGQYDVVYGYFDKRKHNAFRNLTSKASRWLIHKSVPGISRFYSNYRIFTRFICDRLSQFKEDFLYTDGLISWITTNTSHVLVDHHERHSGESNYTFTKLIRYFTTVLFNFTTLPLTFVIRLGFITAIVGLLLGLLFFTLRIIGVVVQPGFAAIIVSIFFLNGINLIALGIIGEYLGNIFIKQTGKPQYSIRNRSDEA